MAKAVGIGGVFLTFKGNEKELFDWYQGNLGLEMSSYGSGFIEGEQLVLLSFKRDSSKNLPLINFRVDDIQELIKKFSNDGITILQAIEDYDYGKFARIIDPFGNVIELWEPKEETYKEMVNQEIKEYNNRRKQ